MHFQFQEGLIDQLFDCLGDVVYCLKDLDGRYVDVNQAFAERVGANDKYEVIGKTAADFFSSDLARVYQEQDQRVFGSSRPLRDQLELISQSDGTAGWYLANKFPIFDAEDKITGLVGMSQDLKTPSDSDLELADLRKVVDYIRSNLDQSLKTEELAALVGLSSTQLDRRMRRIFRLTTKKYVMKCRLELACRLLKESEQSIADVSLACGFSDQSAFTRQFGTAVNQTPLAYRKSHTQQ